MTNVDACGGCACMHGHVRADDERRRRTTYRHNAMPPAWVPTSKSLPEVVPAGRALRFVASGAGDLGGAASQQRRGSGGRYLPTIGCLA